MKSPFSTDSYQSTNATGDAGTRETRRRGIRLAAVRGLMLAGATTLGAVAGTGIGLTDPIAMATECDCFDGSCDACGSGGTAEPNNFLYKSLDALAGGIEKVLGLDKSRASSCDDACDAVSMHELMMPMAPMQMHSPSTTHVHPHASTYNSTPYMPAPNQVPQRQYVPAPPASVPGIVEAPVEIRQTEPKVLPPVNNMIPQPVPEPQPMPKAEPKPGGSLFDALDDPFSDDEVRNYRPYRNVRPSGFLQKAGSTSTQQNGATTVRPSTGTPARKATHRTPTPTLTPPVRRTSINDQQAIGSGVIRTSAAIPRSVTPQPAVTPTSTRKNSSSIVELSPTDYLSSARSASKNR